MRDLRGDLTGSPGFKHAEVMAAERDFDRLIRPCLWHSGQVLSEAGKRRPRSRGRDCHWPEAWLQVLDEVNGGEIHPLIVGYGLIRRHSSAHLRHAAAHSRQWSIACFSHSSAHASQISAHKVQIWRANSLPRLMKVAAVRQMEAQSRSSAMHLASACTSFSCKHDVAQ